MAVNLHVPQQSSTHHGEIFQGDMFKVHCVLKVADLLRILQMTIESVSMS